MIPSDSEDDEPSRSRPYLFLASTFVKTMLRKMKLPNKDAIKDTQISILVSGLHGFFITKWIMDSKPLSCR